MQDSRQEIWTVGAILKTVADFLGEKGCETPRLDAEVLLSHVLGANRISLYTGYDRPLLPRELDDFREFVKRRAAGEPAAYLVGKKEFYSLEFSVGPGVLIPRPETEFLAAAAIDHAKCNRNSFVADLGTGSGCVAITLAVYVPGCEVIAVDRSGAAVECARRNASSHDVQDRVTVVEGDLFQPLERMNLSGKLDIIVANPPYISEAEFDKLHDSVRKYEPREALLAGRLGTEFHSLIVERSSAFLKKGGLLAVEAGAGQSESICVAIRGRADYGEPSTVEDYGGIKRIVAARRV